MLALLLASTFAHAGVTPLCAPPRCALSGYLDADAHIHEPEASGRYLVFIAVYSGGLRSTVDGVVPRTSSTTAATRYGVPAADLAGATRVYVGTSSVDLTSTRPGATTVDVNLTNTSRGTTEYQIWVIN